MLINHNAYLNIVHGDDATAEIDNPAKPYRSLAVAVAAGKELAKPGQVNVHIIDQGAVDPAKFAAK